MGEKNKKGFSGLAGLTSDIKLIEESLISEQKSETKPPLAKQATSSQSKVPTSKVQSDSQPLSEDISGEKSNSGSLGKWIFGVFSVLFVIWFISYSLNRTSSHNVLSKNSGTLQNDLTSEVGASREVESSDLQYTKPVSASADNVLSIPEIRWCIRESIRIKAMQTIIDTNSGVDELNRSIEDYNNHCGSYRYEQGSQQSAERDVELSRSQIVAEALQEARKLSKPSLATAPLASLNDSTSNPTSIVALPAIQAPNAFQNYLTQSNRLVTDSSNLDSSAAPMPIKLTPLEAVNARFKIVVKTEQANIRLSPEKKANILGVVMQEQKLDVIDESGDYFLVKITEADGFIHKSVVQGLDGSNFSPPKLDGSNLSVIAITQNNASPQVNYPLVSPAKSSKANFQVTVKTLQANVRSSPQKADNILGVIKQGQILDVIDAVDDYFLVSTTLGDVFIHNSTVENDIE
jgi:uncharacterized protein YgiM (DUF1202 family)